MKLKVNNFFAIALTVLVVAALGSLITSVLNKGFDTDFSRWFSIVVFALLGLTLVVSSFVFVFVRKKESHAVKLFVFGALLFGGSDLVVAILLYGAGHYVVSDLMLVVRLVLTALSSLLALSLMVV